MAMKPGLMTDIHEHVEHLKTALNRFQVEGVDQVVVIGDVFETGERIDETCRLLAGADAIGVWGNHDFGLCVEPNEEFRTKYGDDAINFMTSLKPRLDVILNAVIVDTSPKRKQVKSSKLPPPRLRFGLVWIVSFFTAWSIRSIEVFCKPL